MDTHTRRGYHSSEIMLAFLCGALTGAVVALMYAPERAREAAAEARARGEQALDRMRHEAGDVIADARTAFKAARSQAANPDRS